MSSTDSFVSSFPRYLAAKRTVDDRALNHHVWSSLQRRLRDLPPPVRIVEIGGGIGTMLERLLEVHSLPHLDYYLLDADVTNIATARQRLGARPDLAVIHHTNAGSRRPTSHSVTLHHGDFLDYLAPESASLFNHAHVVIAHAFLDLLDIDEVLPRLTALLPPHTLTYFTINFDGATILQPTIEPEFDTLVERLYHRTMDERITDGRPSGDSQTGRHLFHAMQKAGIQVVDAGSSDWVVFAQRGAYPADEAYFLHFILDTMHGALRNHPQLDSARFTAWIDRRHAQVEAGELLYIAHQMDYLGIVQAVA